MSFVIIVKSRYTVIITQIADKNFHSGKGLALPSSVNWHK